MFTWLLVIAIAGLVCSTGFLALIIVAATKFRRRSKSVAPATAVLPPVTLLKPLCGLEPNLEANLASFFDQDYPQFEIIFGMRNAQDPALKIVRGLQMRFPQVPVKVVFSGEPDRPNAKVCSLEKMCAQASHEFLVISDSDVQVTPSYVRDLVPPLLDSKVGMAWCLYRGVPTGGLWTRLEALGMSVEMSSGVIVADLLADVDFALGPSMALRREVLERVGGMGPLADYCADDFVLGNKIARAGYKILIADHLIDHVVTNRSLVPSLRHQVRWARSTRFSRPAGHFSSVLTYAMPFGLLGLSVAVIAGMPGLGLGLLGWAIANRWFMAIAAGYNVVRDREALRYFWIYPLRDLLGFVFWCGSYFGNTIEWRGEKYRLMRGGSMVRVGEGAKPKSPKVAVNDLS